MTALDQYKEGVYPIKNIGVIMFGLLGDVLLRTPVLNALKILHPDAKITVIVDPIGVAIFKDNPHVDNIIKIDRSKKSKYRYYMDKVIGIKKIRSKKFDLFIDLYNNSSSKVLIKSSGAKFKVGFLSEKGKYAYNIMSDADQIKHNNNSLSIHHLKILYPLKNTLDYSIQETLVVKKSTLNYLDDYIKEFNFDSKHLYTLNLGSRANDKILSNTDYLTVVKYLYEKYSYIPAILCNPGQEYLQESFITDCLDKNSLPYIKLKGLQIEEVGAVMKLTKFTVTPDTGPLHIAASAKAPILGLFIWTPSDEVTPEGSIFMSLNQDLLKGKEFQEIIDSFVMAI